MMVRIHVCLVSAEASPNLAPLCDPAFKPNAVILLASNDMQRQAGWLQDAMMRSGVKTSIHPLRDPWHASTICADLLAAIAGVSHEHLMLNATGGTKPMSIALTQWFVQHDLPVFYVRHDAGNIIWLHPDKPSQTMNHRLRLPQFLQAYGIQSAKPQREPLNEELKTLTATIIGHGQAWFPAMRQLNALAFHAMNAKLQATLERRPTSDLHALLQLLRQHGYIQRHQRTITFRDEASRSLLNGGWFEAYVMDVVQSLRDEEAAIHDVAYNLDVTYGDVRNELDVALLCRNRLWVIECKTRQSKENKAEQVYKLDSVSGRIGGARAGGMLVSYQPLPSPTRQRAADMGIRHCSGVELAQLNTHLRKWLSL